MAIIGRRKQCVKLVSTEKATVKSVDNSSFDKMDSESVMSFKTRIILFVIKALVHVFGILMIPLNFCFQKPWKRWTADRTVWAKLFDENDPHSPCVRSGKNCNKTWNPFEDVNTVHELFQLAVKTHGSKNCVGVREVLAEAVEYNKNGKVLNKVRLANKYTWHSYLDIEKRVEDLTKGLLELGLQPKKQVAIFAETRIEWMILCQACFRINVPVATVYATLGQEGVIHALNETEVTHIFTSQDLLPKLQKIISSTPAVTNIVYMENIKPVDISAFPEKMSVISFSQLEKMGTTCDPISKPDPPAPNDLAVIMYTSGSTGIPKGVLITHKNIIATITGILDCIPVLKPTDVYIGYLPLAHVFEIASECYFFVMGTPVGYSSPHTITDRATAIMTGCKGDISLLKPSIMCAVPLMLDRIRKYVNELVVTDYGDLGQEVLRFLIQYKLTWYRRGFGTPILNRLVFNKIKQRFGGQVRVMVCGGAPLSPDTHDFIRMCLDVKMLQAYGMTETAGSATIMSLNDYSTGKVGAPLSNCYIRLEDWPEGNYFAKDRPYPRGEIVIGGDCVTLGYYKNEALSKECFKEEGDVKWFYTGDIGELHANGTFKIIDRKKDLVKLQYGEYISLGKVESELKTCPYVDNICAVGNGLHDYLVALIVPNMMQLQNLAATLGKKDLSTSDLCHDDEIVSAVMKAIIEHGQKSKLMRTEIPTKVTLCSEEWQPENGLVTAAFKIRRKVIEQYYQNSIEKMYNQQLNGTSKST